MNGLFDSPVARIFGLAGHRCGVMSLWHHTPCPHPENLIFPAELEVAGRRVAGDSSNPSPQASQLWLGSRIVVPPPHRWEGARHNPQPHWSWEACVCVGGYWVQLYAAASPLDNSGWQAESCHAQSHSTALLPNLPSFSGAGDHAISAFPPPPKGWQQWKNVVVLVQTMLKINFSWCSSQKVNRSQIIWG